MYTKNNHNMKKVSTTIILVLMPLLFLSAQTHKGSWVVGVGSKLNRSPIILPKNIQSPAFGGINFSKGSGVLSSTVTNVNFQPSFGYFLAEGLMTGIRLDFAYTALDKSIFKSLSFGAGPEVRQYFLKGNLRPYLGTSVLFSKSILTQTDISGQNQNHESLKNAFNAYTGLAFFPVDNLSFDFQVGYGYFSQTFNTSRKKANYQGIELSLGFNFFF
jgi:opacity protein-like surface antigen